MALKEIFVPYFGTTVKMGRRHPVAKGMRLMLKRYLDFKALPPPPTTVDYSAPAATELANPYLNAGQNAIGDCVIAAGYHMVAVETGNSGSGTFAVTNDQLIADYSAIGGYNPNAPLVPDPNHPGQMINPTDQGCDEITALNYWCDHGLADGTTATAWIAVDASNQQELSTALFLFQNLFFAMDLPDEWINPGPSGPGFVWDVAGNPDAQNGHVVTGVGYTPQGATIDTWGILGTMTWAAIAKYCSQANDGGVYVMLTPDELVKAQQASPHGVKWSDLVNDLNSLGANIPVITSAATLNATVGQAASYQITATNSPTKFAASGLPPGLTVAATTGVISGKPTKAGTYQMTVSAANANGAGSKIVAVTVKSAPPVVKPPVVTSPSAATATVGKPFTYKITATNSPTSFGATGLPGSLHLSGSTISGTPTQAGSFTLQVSATNSAGTGTRSVNLTVKPVVTHTSPTHTSPTHTSPTHTSPTHTGPTHTGPSTSGSGIPPVGFQSAWVPPPIYPVPPLPSVPSPTPQLADIGRQLFGSLQGGLQGPRKLGIVAASGIVMQGLLTVLAISEDGSGPTNAR